MSKPTTKAGFVVLDSKTGKPVHVSVLQGNGLGNSDGRVVFVAPNALIPLENANAHFSRKTEDGTVWFDSSASAPAEGFTTFDFVKAI
jgi:hypothetical protein